jgi:hypothetical protein
MTVSDLIQEKRFPTNGTGWPPPTFIVPMATIHFSCLSSGDKYHKYGYIESLNETVDGFSVTKQPVNSPATG